MKLFLSTVLASMLAISLSAQSTAVIQGHILYKGYPYFVSMTPQGDILEFLKTAPEIMPSPNAYMAMQPPMPLGPYVKPVAVALAEYNSPLNSAHDGDVVILDGSVEDEKSSDSKPAGKADGADNKNVEKEMKTTVIRRDDDKTDLPDVKVVNAERESNAVGTDLKFQGFTARLTPTLINQLKDIHQQYQKNPKQEILIRSFVTSGDNTNLKLAENRMEACRDLLSTYGVPDDKMTMKVEPYRSANSGQINILLQ